MVRAVQCRNAESLKTQSCCPRTSSALSASPRFKISPAEHGHVLTPSRSTSELFVPVMRQLLGFILLCCLVVTSLGQPSGQLFAQTQTSKQQVKDYDLGGASKPKPSKRLGNRVGHYKRVHQSSLRAILRENFDETENYLNEFLKANPNDAETFYMLGILAAKRGNVKLAEAKMRQALAAGLPAGRILAGPRPLVQPLKQTELFRELDSRFESELVHGPMVGNVTGGSADFWVRTGKVQNVEVVVFTEAGKEVARGEKIRSRKDQDFTCVVNVAGLQPNTEYRYQVRLDGNKVPTASNLSFRTLANPRQATKFRVAFGGGAGYVPKNERMWTTIGGFDPQAVLLLGDNVYIDDPESVDMQQYTYHRRQSRPEWRKLTSRSPVYTIWDDHDFGCDDCWGGADIAVPFWKKELVFPIFRQNWANPGYGGGDQQPGCWYSFQIGDVDFVMLDCRYYRTNPKSEGKSMLGPVQLKWLKDKLKSLTGRFKVICSSVPWDFRTKGDSLDTWNGFKEEHEEILSYVELHKIEGVVLLSADRHRSDCWKIDRPGGYDLFDFNSSRLTNEHVHPTMEKAGAVFSYNAKQSFGLVTFDTTLQDPELTYEIVDIDGKQHFSITEKLSNLVPKASNRRR